MSSDSRRCHACYNEFFDQNDWTDIWRILHPEEKRFTSFQKGSYARIDHAMASPTFLTHVQQAEIGIAYATDHAPVYVGFSTDQGDRGKGCWRMPSHLLSDPVFINRVENILDKAASNSEQLDPNQVWDFAKTAIRGESIQYLGECHKRKLSWTKTIDRDIQTIALVQDRVHDQPQLVCKYTQQLSLMEIERDQLVETRSKETRDFNVARKYYEMNRPTKYYYRLPGSKHDAIKAIQTPNGLVYHSKGILQECHSFYTDLYCKEPHRDALDEHVQWKFLQHIPAVMNIESYDKLDEGFTQLELYNALKRMKVDASPGMDGLTVEFYLQFWHAAGPLLFQSVLFSQQQQNLSPSQRRGLVHLIPKKNKNPFFVKNWRPIMLLNVDYKIISKALALCLAQVLLDLVGQDE